MNSDGFLGNVPTVVPGRGAKVVVGAVDSRAAVTAVAAVTGVAALGPG